MTGMKSTDTSVRRDTGLELIVAHPGGGGLASGYLRGDPKAAAFFPSDFRSLAAYQEKAREVDGRFDRDARARAAEAMVVPEGASSERLERFVEEGGYLVTTGQQPALFGGPLYSTLKGLTAVCLAERLERALGKPVLPLFWVGSEDHDWEEAGHVDLIGVDNELHHLVLDRPTGAPPSSIHRIPLPEEITPLLERFVALLPPTEFSQEYVRLLRDAFCPGATLSEGFHRTMQHLLGRFGLYFTDASHPVVKSRSAAILLGELDRAGHFEGVLVEAQERLVGAGFDPQVPILEQGVNLFLDGDAGRERIYREGAGFRLRLSGAFLSASELRARFDADPSVLSPNVLLRPVVESAVFPTLAYVGGPGEIAYFGQLRDYFEAHGIGMPVLHPRWAVTPVESKIRKVLDKFGVGIDTLASPFHEVAAAIAREEVPTEVRAVLGKIRGDIARGVGELQKVVQPIDPTLKQPVQHVRSAALDALEDVEKRIVRAVKREREISLQQLEKAQVHLFPSGRPAERVQSPFYYLARYGDAFLDALHDRFEVTLD